MRTWLYFLLFISSSANAIVAVENLHLDDTNLGWSGDVSFDLNGSSGNSDKSDGRFGATSIWRTAGYINYATASYEYGESNDQVDTKNTFVRARHVRKHNESFDLEYFVQAEKDEFARLNSRYLVGAGPRFEHPWGGFIGVGAFYFRERLDDTLSFGDELEDEGVRFSTYISSEYALDDRVSFAARLYLQPRVNTLEDTRALLNASMTFVVTDTINLKLGLRANHDSKPAIGVEATNIYYTSGLEYSF